MIRRTSRAAFERLEHRRLLNAVIRVDVNSTAPQPDGASWPNAYADLQQALAVATASTDIWIADGTYRPTSGTDRTIKFELKEGVSLYGGYAGIGAANPDQRDFDQFVTSLSGNIGDANSALDNSYNVVYGQPEAFIAFITSATVIDGLTIRDGRADVYEVATSGGGMLLQNATPIIANCTFVNNGFMGVGGGLAMFDTVPQFDYPPLETISISDCRFTGNYFVDNTQYIISGGGMYVSAKAVIERCEFVENSAPAGGGLYVARFAATVRGCLLERNTAMSGAGMMLETGAQVFNSRFHGNLATIAGGAVRVKTSQGHQFVNCNFVGNRAEGELYQQGGAVWVSSGSVTLANCTIVANTAVNSGGGVHRGGGSFTLRNSVVRDNFAPTSPQLTAGTVSNSNVEGGFTGTGNIDADAHFVRDPSPGADNTWGTTDDDYGDLRLQITSPNIDAGDNASIPAGVTTDIDGRARFFDFPGVNDGAGAVVDIGAHELDLRLGLLRVDAGQSLNLPAGGHTFYVEQLAIESGATLNVRDDSLIIDYTGASQLSSVQALINSGRAGGSWTGAGMTSSSARDNPLHNTTLGAMEAVDFKSIYGPSAHFGGHAFDSTAVLVKYTYYGDADFNGVVNFDDYARIDFGFANHRSGWNNGDFDGNGEVNFDDYSLIDLAFNTKGSSLRPSVLPSKGGLKAGR